MIVRVLDIETRGLDPDSGVCEIATVDLVRDGDDERAPWQRGRMWRSFINPGKPIPPETSAVHHITDADVKDAPTLEAMFAEHALAPAEDGKPPAFFAAHRAAFEQSFIGALMPAGTQWICSYKVGVTCYPESPSHSNQCLKYFLGLKLDQALAMPPHRAAADAYTTAAILRHIFKSFVITPADMVDISSKPVLLPRFHFGKWAGRPLAEIETGYLRWVAAQPDMDADARYTAECYLHDRQAAANNQKGSNA
jgi:exodeoxyribonuclease X